MLLQKSLPRLGSDHVPIRIEVGSLVSNPRPFRFELAWTTSDGFQELISQWWSDLALVGCGAFILAKKLIGLKGLLRHWAKFNFGSIKFKKLALLHEVEEMDITKESRGLSTLEIQQEKVLLDNLEKICKQEEIYWRQRFRVQWLAEGNKNMRFFHTVVDRLKNRNFIPSIRVNGVSVSNSDDIGKIFVSRFQQ